MSDINTVRSSGVLSVEPKPSGQEERHNRRHVYDACRHLQ